MLCYKTNLQFPKNKDAISDEDLMLDTSVISTGEILPQSRAPFHYSPLKKETVEEVLENLTQIIRSLFEWGRRFIINAISKTSLSCKGILAMTIRRTSLITATAAWWQSWDNVLNFCIFFTFQIERWAPDTEPESPCYNRKTAKNRECLSLFNLPKCLSFSTDDIWHIKRDNISLFVGKPFSHWPGWFKLQILH